MKAKSQRQSPAKYDESHIHRVSLLELERELNRAMQPIRIWVSDIPVPPTREQGKGKTE